MSGRRRETIKRKKNRIANAMKLQPLRMADLRRRNPVSAVLQSKQSWPLGYVQRGSQRRRAQKVTSAGDNGFPPARETIPAGIAPALAASSLADVSYLVALRVPPNP